MVTCAGVTVEGGVDQVTLTKSQFRWLTWCIAGAARTAVGSVSTQEAGGLGPADTTGPHKLMHVGSVRMEGAVYLRDGAGAQDSMCEAAC